MGLSQKVEQNDKEMENKREVIRNLEGQSRPCVSGVPERTEEIGEEILKTKQNKDSRTLKNIHCHSELR